MTFSDSAAMLSLAAAAFDLLTFISFAFADNSNCDACESEQEVASKGEQPASLPINPVLSNSSYEYKGTSKEHIVYSVFVKHHM